MEQGSDERQVVCLDDEGGPFDEMEEMADGSMDGEQLPVEGGVARIGHNIKGLHHRSLHTHTHTNRQKMCIHKIKYYLIKSNST